MNPFGEPDIKKITIPDATEIIRKSDKKWEKRKNENNERIKAKQAKEILG